MINVALVNAKGKVSYAWYTAFQYAVDMDILRPNSVEGERIRKVCKDDSLIEIPQMKCDIMGEIRL